MSAFSEFDAVHDQLRERILRGQLPPGEEMSQVQLAKEMGVSRTPLREALRMLQREGLVDGETKKSSRVAGFSLSDLEGLYTQRLPLEALAVRLATSRVTSSDIAALEGAMAQMAHFAALEEYENWEVPHRDFHRRLVTHSGPRMATLLAQLSDYSERYRRLYTTQQPRAWTSGVTEHRTILDAVSNGDIDGAVAGLVEHLAHTARSVIEMVDPGYEAVDLKVAVEFALPPARGSRRHPASRGTRATSAASQSRKEST